MGTLYEIREAYGGHRIAYIVARDPDDALRHWLGDFYGDCRYMYEARVAAPQEDI